MARRKLNENQKPKTLTASISQKLDAVVRALANDRRWSVAQAGGFLIENAVENLGLLDKYAANAELARHLEKKKEVTA